MRFSTVIGTLCLAITAPLLLPTPAAAVVDPACNQRPAINDPIKEVPWAQNLYQASEKIWPFSKGAGITVAVIDSGVESRHPQLSGRVLRGYDFVRKTAEGNVECQPHGTAVASIIAANKTDGIGFFGLAPDARILPVRISDRAQTSRSQSGQLDVGALAAGINYAVDQGANVLNISVVVHNDRRVAQAVRRALSRGVVVVAAVGDGHSRERNGSGPTDGRLTPYPAAYSGVIGVGAVEQDEQRVPMSQIGGYVDLVAPGGNVTAAGEGGHQVYNGTSFASAFVSASAALLLAQRPSILGRVKGAAQPAAVLKRLIATASPAAGGPNYAYGHGIVDPYRALTERTTGVSPTPVPGQIPPPRDLVAEQLAADRRNTNGDSMLLGAAIAVVVLVVTAAVVFLPRGRRRHWRAGRAIEAQRGGSEDGPEFLPGEALFQPAPEPSRTSRSPSRSP